MDVFQREKTLSTKKNLGFRDSTITRDEARDAKVQNQIIKGFKNRNKGRLDSDMLLTMWVEGETNLLINCK